ARRGGACQEGGVGRGRPRQPQSSRRRDDDEHGDGQCEAATGSHDTTPRSCMTRVRVGNFPDEDRRTERLMADKHKQAEDMRDDVPSTIARSDDKAVRTYKETLESAEETYGDGE